jgi:hypothetical protein
VTDLPPDRRYFYGDLSAPNDADWKSWIDGKLSEPPREPHGSCLKIVAGVIAFTLLCFLGFAWLIQR